MFEDYSALTPSELEVVYASDNYFEQFKRALQLRLKSGVKVDTIITTLYCMEEKCEGNGNIMAWVSWIIAFILLIEYFHYFQIFRRDFMFGCWNIFPRNPKTNYTIGYPLMWQLKKLKKEFAEWAPAWHIWCTTIFEQRIKFNLKKVDLLSIQWPTADSYYFEGKIRVFFSV